jgi:hypothetical protein
MSDTDARDSIGIMFSNLPHIRRYAAKAIMGDDDLTEAEEQDKTARMRQFFRTGESLNWTPKEMVALILRETMAKA